MDIWWLAALWSGLLAPLAAVAILQRKRTLLSFLALMCLTALAVIACRQLGWPGSLKWLTGLGIGQGSILVGRTLGPSIPSQPVTKFQAYLGCSLLLGAFILNVVNETVCKAH